MSSPFAFAPPALASTPSPSPFFSLLSSLESTRTFPELLTLSQGLLDTRIESLVKREMAVLAGELRDEWKVRVGAVKADWFARWIPEEELEEDEEEEEGKSGDGDQRSRGDEAKVNGVVGGASPRVSGEVEGAATANSTPTPPLVPTIISDSDATAAMSSRVDASVEQEFAARIKEAELRVREAARKKEVLEVELFIGGCVRRCSLCFPVCPAQCRC
jgi:hypothetical protein